MSLCYTIKEIIPDNDYDIDVIQKEVMDKFNEMQANETQGTEAQGTGTEEIESRFFAQKLEYSLNYKVKELFAILDYYNLPKRKMCKEGMINSILEYENHKENSDIVNMRKRLWKYAKELKKDKYFSKILLFDF